MVNKKGAIELSIGTIVVLVIAMTMLVMGIVLVRTIFTGATDSVKDLNEKVKGEIRELFTDESRDVMIRLGSDKTARVRAGTNSFGIAIGARTKDGSSVSGREQLKYTLTLDESSNNNCIDILSVGEIEDMFFQTIGDAISFDSYQDDVVFARVQINIPEGTPVCSQKVFVDVVDTTEDVIGGDSFIIQILKKGFF